MATCADRALFDRTYLKTRSNQTQSYTELLETLMITNLYPDSMVAAWRKLIRVIPDGELLPALKLNQVVSSEESEAPAQVTELIASLSQVQKNHLLIALQKTQHAEPN